jgi:hypothetical protein
MIEVLAYAGAILLTLGLNLIVFGVLIEIMWQVGKFLDRR